jgi:hypothetical protein
MRRLLLIAVLGAITGGTAAAALYADTGQSAGMANPQLVREQNLDPDGLIRVHEQGTPSVQVKTSAENPLEVDDVDVPASVPFQRQLDGDGGGFTVPLGRTLVLEYISARCNGDIARVSILTKVDGVTLVHDIPGLPNSVPKPSSDRSCASTRTPTRRWLPASGWSTATSPSLAR